MTKVKSVTNWGSYPKIEANYTELEFLDEVKDFVEKQDTLIARGNGRCYGDSSLNNNIFSTLKLNKFIAFDANTGEIEVQAGCLLSEILDFSIPKGFFLPVTPGTKYITVGGALASDIHGKNHHSEGCFSDHTISFQLMLGNGEIINCSRTENAHLFWETAGGMGLTGIIISVRFTLKPIETAYIRMESVKAKNLEEAIAIFEESASWTYNVSWIDCLQKGKNIGRSIMMRGEHALLSELPASKKTNPLSVQNKPKLNVPIYFPNFVLNTLTVKAFNFAYWNKQQAKQKNIIQHYNSFFYPLDAINNWNRIYGKKGFTQYQFVIPLEGGKQGLEKILSTIANSGQGSFLAVLKQFGKNNPLAKNSFPMEGYTLALDFKLTNKLYDLIKKLDIIVHDHGGHLYLAKDALSRDDMFIFDKDIANGSKFTSLQYKRLFSDK